MELFDQSTITFRQIKSSMEVPGPLTQLFPHFNEKFPWNLNWINVWAVKLSIYFENEEVGFDIFIIFLILQIQGPGRRRKKHFFKKGEQSAP